LDAPAHRASDAEREAVVERLRQAAAEGRLDADELGDRVESAYRAQTVTDLEPLTADLPPVPAPKAAAISIWHNEGVRNRLLALLTANPVCLLIWVASGTGGDFWPRWVLLGTAAAFIVTFVRTWLGIERDERHQLEAPRPPRLPHDR
jgi:hypothetical protein